MIVGVLLVAGALSGAQAVATAARPAAAKPAAAQPKAQGSQVYRLDVAGHMTLWAKDRPMQSGSTIVFHRFPDGVLVSIKSADVARIVATRYAASTPTTIQSGAVVDLGITGTGGANSAAAAGRRASEDEAQPGERKNGTALFNPDRPYKPEWDSKQVPGLNIGNPNSPNDYREGKTFAYPPATATQAGPGDLPRAPVETGDPRSPQ